MKKLLLLSLMLCFGLASFGQNYTNISLQAGYNVKFLNPRPLNSVIDSFNFYSNLTTRMEGVGPATGFFAAVGLHPGRTHFRFEAMNYATSVSGIGMDDNGDEFRRDMDVMGARFSAAFTSELIRMWPESHFCVGASFNVNYLQINSASVLTSEYDPEAPLDEIMTSWKPSFTINAPFRIGIGSQVKLSIEPYYQIYFGPTNFRDVNAELNPATFQNTPVNVEESDLDHFGLTGAVIVSCVRDKPLRLLTD